MKDKLFIFLCLAGILAAAATAVWVSWWTFNEKYPNASVWAWVFDK